jgi:hypothetical protein
MGEPHRLCPLETRVPARNPPAITLSAPVALPASCDPPLALTTPHQLKRRPMVKLADAFRKQFSHWGISLPELDVRNRSPGVIHQGGWTIRYHFGVEDGREYLEYFAGHRMTNDRLVRICEDGSSETLDACQEFYSPQDPDGETNMTATVVVSIQHLLGKPAVVGVEVHPSSPNAGAHCWLGLLEVALRRPFHLALGRRQGLVRKGSEFPDDSLQSIEFLR